MNTFTSPNASVMEILEPFFGGLNNNKSITTLNFYGRDLLDGQIFTMMVPFFKNNDNFEVISIEECIFGDEGSRLLALALGNCKTSLQSVTLMNNDTTEEGLVDIITSLSMHPNIHYLDLDGNQMNTNGCIAMAALLQHSCTELQHLDLSRIELDDEGIDILVPALKNSSNLHKLYMHDNDPVTSRGWQHLASILASPNSNLITVGMASNNVDDKALAAFASSLVNNRTLRTLNLNRNGRITDEGWNAFSKLLCDTTSVNSTFLSNHTLTVSSSADSDSNTRASLTPLVELNENEDKKEVAMIKILQHHNDVNMMPFFEWEFKVLPLVINWFERASSITSMPENFEPNIGPRNLSSIYQFVRGMPLLYVEARLRRELEEIKIAEAQMEEEQQELTGKLLDLETKHQLSQKRKRHIMERLDQRL